MRHQAALHEDPFIFESVKAGWTMCLSGTTTSCGVLVRFLACSLLASDLHLGNVHARLRESPALGAEYFLFSATDGSRCARMPRKSIGPRSGYSIACWSASVPSCLRIILFNVHSSDYTQLEIHLSINQIQTYSSTGQYNLNNEKSEDGV